MAFDVESGLDLRQNYDRLTLPLAMQVGRYAHTKQFRRMRKALKKLKGCTGRVLHDIRRPLQDLPERALRGGFARTCSQQTLAGWQAAAADRDKQR